MTTPPVPSGAGTPPAPDRDDRTGRGYPLPHPDNLLEVDAHRLRAAVTQVDADVSELEVLLLALGN